MYRMVLLLVQVQAQRPESLKLRRISQGILGPDGLYGIKPGRALEKSTQASLRLVIPMIKAKSGRRARCIHEFESIWWSMLRLVVVSLKSGCEDLLK